MRAKRRYRETHGGKRQSLVQLQESITAEAVHQPGEIRRIAKELQVPEATLRGVLSFYTDFQSQSERDAGLPGDFLQTGRRGDPSLFASLPL